MKLKIYTLLVIIHLKCLDESIIMKATIIKNIDWACIDYTIKETSYKMPIDHLICQHPYGISFVDSRPRDDYDKQHIIGAYYYDKNNNELRLFHRFIQSNIYGTVLHLFLIGFTENEIDIIKGSFNHCTIYIISPEQLEKFISSYGRFCISTEVEESLIKKSGRKEKLLVPCQIRSNILLGDYRNAKNWGLKFACKDENVVIINCRESDYKNKLEDFADIKHFPLQDNENQIIDFNKVIGIINNAHKNNKKVFVHCEAGISRAPTVVIAYLIWKENMSFDDAINDVKSKRSNIEPNGNFCEQLKQFRQECRKNQNQ